MPWLGEVRMAAKSNYKQVFATKKKGLKRALNTALQEESYEAISLLIDRTPVDTGAARAHWFAKGTPTGSFDKDTTDPSGSAAKSRARSDLQSVRIGDRVFLVNTAPYFSQLERGSSDQAPQGIIGITVQEMRLKWRKNLKVAMAKEGIK